MSFVSRAHGTTWFISRRNRSRRVIFFLDSKAREAKVVCFILVLLMPVRAVVSAHWTGGLVHSFLRYQGQLCYGAPQLSTSLRIPIFPGGWCIFQSGLGRAGVDV